MKIRSQHTVLRSSSFLISLGTYYIRKPFTGFFFENLFSLCPLFRLSTRLIIIYIRVHELLLEHTT